MQQTEIRRLNDLKATNPYLRMGTDVSDLEKSIKTVGLIAPLVISADNVILAGARRFQAMLNLGFTEAPVLVKDLSELEKELISIDENLVRKDLSKIELEGHLRRAKEIYQALNPHEDEELKKELQAKKNEELNDLPEEERVKYEAKEIEVLPAQKFLEMVSEKTGLSTKQIHEAISRDEKAHEEIKEARQNGELSLSQTNEIIKLDKADQPKVVNQLKNLPVKEIRKFVKKAKTTGIETALKEIPRNPHAREFTEVEATLKKLNKRLKQLELEGILIHHMPETIREQFNILQIYVGLEERYTDQVQSEEVFYN